MNELTFVSFDICFNIMLTSVDTKAVFLADSVDSTLSWWSITKNAPNVMWERQQP